MIFEGIRYIVSNPDAFNCEGKYPTVIVMHGAERGATN